jgi:hypothetical protein
MQTLTNSVACPLCGQLATVSLSDDPDPARGTEGHRVEFQCSNRCNSLDDAHLLRLWAASRAPSITTDG